MPDYLNPNSNDYAYPLSPDPQHTQKGWEIILYLCREKLHFGFNILDSFLDGPDLDHRINLIIKEVPQNHWLTGELKDTLSLNQNENLTPEQLSKLRQAIK